MVYLCAAANGAGERRRFFGVESWNWPDDARVTVLCFANCPEVILTLNHQVIGTKKLSEAVRGVLSWQVPWQAGTLTATGYRDGKEICHYTLQTAGAPARIELLPDTTQLRADGKDVAHVEFRIVDAQGVRVPDAAPGVTFEMSGPARLLGLGSGDLNSTENCKTDTHHAFQGRGLAILQSTAIPGGITLKAAAPGLAPASVTLQSR